MKIPTRDAMALSVGIELVVSIMLGLGVGWWLDRRFATSPLFVIIGIVYGTAAGIRSIIRVMRRADSENETPDQP